MRIVGVDLGRARIGIAVGETEHRIATPRPAIAASGSLAKDAAAISQLARDEQAEAIVVGIPESLGDRSQMAKACAKLADVIRLAGWETHTIDESLSSMEASQQLADHDWTAATRRKHIDSQAACVILERFFDVQGR